MARSTRRPSRRDAAKKNKALKDRMGLVFITLILLIFAGGGYWYLNQPPRDRYDDIGCLTNRPPPELVAFVIDRTDPMRPTQAEQIKNELRKIQLNLPRHAELRAYTVGSVSQKTLSHDFRACFPGDPSDINKWTEPQRRAEQRWREFNEEFDRYLTGIAPSTSESQSPLIESIQSISATTFTDPKFNSEPSTKKRLIMVSDMLQNSNLFSHYRVWLNCKTDIVGAVEQCVEKSSKKGETCTMFGGRRSRSCEQSVATNLNYNYWKERVGTRLNSEMRNVAVEILYVRREGSAQQGGGDHATFWRDYFEDNGGSLARLRSID